MNTRSYNRQLVRSLNSAVDESPVVAITSVSGSCLQASSVGTMIFSTFRSADALGHENDPFMIPNLLEVRKVGYLA